MGVHDIAATSTLAAAAAHTSHTRSHQGPAPARRAATFASAAPRGRRPRHDPNRPAWAAYLIDLRVSRGLTQAAAAAAMGVSQQTWTGMETGYRQRQGRTVSITPLESTLLRVCRALSVSPAEAEHLWSLVGTRTAVDPRPWQVRLRETRLAARLTMPEAAAAAGVSRAAYTAWETKQSGGVNHSSLARLLQRCEMRDEAITAFLADVPGEGTPARAPSQAHTVGPLPAWSTFLTDKRLEAGLHLAHVDARVGQQSVVRRFELGGWPRRDGRLSVPTVAWLDRIATALEMSSRDRACLHVLADNQRVVCAAAGPRPLAAEILAEARRAAGLHARDVSSAVPGLPRPWVDYERGTPEALVTLDDESVHQAIVAGLSMGAVLATALRAQLQAAHTRDPSLAAQSISAAKEAVGEPVGPATAAAAADLAAAAT